MKVSKAGIIMYEDRDPVDGISADNKYPPEEAAWMCVNQLRVEINKIAVLIDDMRERIERLEQKNG